MQHLKMLKEMQGFANLFFAQYWKVVISRSGSKFITSDNPGSEYAPPQKGIDGPTFLERAHHFPLSPDILIRADYRRSYTKMLKRKTAYQNLAVLVTAANTFTANSVYQYAYARERENLEELLKIRGRLQDMAGQTDL